MISSRQDRLQPVIAHWVSSSFFRLQFIRRVLDLHICCHSFTADGLFCERSMCRYVINSECFIHVNFQHYGTVLLRESNRQLPSLDFSP